jgi:Trp operon repressor
MNDLQPNVIKCYCRHCARLNLIPSQPVPDVQAIINATIEHYTAELLEAARDPERIGSRVLMISHQLRQEKDMERISQRDLARELGVSAPAVNTGLARAMAILTRLRQVNLR